MGLIRLFKRIIVTAVLVYLAIYFFPQYKDYLGPMKDKITSYATKNVIEPASEKIVEKAKSVAETAVSSAVEKAKEKISGRNNID